jgi:hypothetical protein
MINRAVPRVTPAILIIVKVEIRETRFFEKRYRLAMFLVRFTLKDTQMTV